MIKILSQLKLENFLPYGKQNIDENDIQEVVKVLNSEYLTQGPIVNKFEEQLCKRVNSKYSTAVNSATSALHISCMALDICNKDIVWTSPNSFVQMLTGSNESWSPYLQQGIDEGRLFSAGPGSYVLADQNLWGNHPDIVNAVRNIQFVDGFQFFSNGTWEDYQYWEEAGNTFFKNKTIVRNISEYENNADLPQNPQASIVQINDLEYQVNISTPDQAVTAYIFSRCSRMDLSDIYSSNVK